MIRPAAALLMLAAIPAFASADDPQLPTPVGPTFGIHPVPEVTGNLPVYSQPEVAPAYSQPVPGTQIESFPAAPFAIPSAAPFGPTYSEPTYGGPTYGAPITESYGPSYPVSGVPTPGTAACPCQANGSTPTGSFPHIDSFQFHTGPAGAPGLYTGAEANGMHVRHPYYSYRRPWYANGPMSHNVTIAW